jgi:cell pole-organizing protein PopZ
MSSPLKAESPGKVQEPSMEEILASIRKIISDDDVKPAKPVTPPVAKAAPPPPPVDEPQGQDDIDALFASFDDPVPEPPKVEQPEVFELTEDMAAPFDANDIDFIDPMPEPEPAPPPPPPQPARKPALSFDRVVPPAAAPRLDDRLISSATDSAISAAFGSLTHTILSQNARTLDDLVQDMLRPMLKSWLDDNLPSLVERLVRGEIERVSRGGR